MQLPISFLDPYLKNLEGHRFMYALRLHEAALRQKISFRILGSSDGALAVFNQLPFEKCFVTPPDAIVKGIGLGRCLNAISSYRTLKHLNRLLDSGHSMLFLEDVMRIYSPPFKRWLGSYLKRPRTGLVVMLRYPCLRPDNGLPLPSPPAYPLLFSDFEAMVAAGAKVFLATDTACLQRQYSKLTSIPIEVLPTLSDVSFKRPPCSRLPQNPLKVMHLGVASAVKGLPQLAKAIRILHEKGRLMDFHFTLHTFTAGYDVPVVKQAIAELKSLETSGCVTLIDSSLDENEYRRIFLSADAVVLPYDKARYQASSAIFTEAMTAGIPVITTEGTWMAEELDNHACGLTIPTNSPEEISGALLRLSSGFEHHARASSSAAGKWIDFHNADTMMNRLMEFASRTLN